MMGERTGAQEALFYGFSIESHVPADHLLQSYKSGHWQPPCLREWSMRANVVSISTKLASADS